MKAELISRMPDTVTPGVMLTCCMSRTDGWCSARFCRGPQHEPGLVDPGADLERRRGGQDWRVSRREERGHRGNICAGDPGE